ncbi:MAG: DEAD/DEAH box helicase [Desulfatiglandales bacterium]
MHRIPSTKSEEWDENNIFKRLEFHRHALALLPDPRDKRPGVAVYVQENRGRPAQRFCSCALSKERTCPHLLEMSNAIKTLKKVKGKTDLDEDFRAGIWYRLSSLLAGGKDATLEEMEFGILKRADGTSLRVYDSDGKEQVTYLSQGADRSRFLERCAPLPEEDRAPHRGSIIDMLSRLTLTDSERMMLDRGFKTRGLSFTESFWYRMAYHCHREFDEERCTFRPAVEEGSGLFSVVCTGEAEGALLRIIIPRHMVKSVLNAFRDILPNQNGMPIHPIPLKSLFHVTMNTDLDLEVRPLIRLIQKDGQERFFEREDLERFRYGDLIFIKEMGIMAEMERPGSDRRFRAPVRMVLKKSQVPVFLEDFGREIHEDHFKVDEKVKSLRIFKGFERIEITPEALDRNWCWLSVRYGSGNVSVGLGEILSARREGQRYIATSEGWIDCRSSELDGIGNSFSGISFEEDKGLLKFSRMDLLRLTGTSDLPLSVMGEDDQSRLLSRILELRPSSPLPNPAGMTSTLRDYQKRGAEWACFMVENGLGGLLCDEMGLGKTHQIMALMSVLKEQEGSEKPFLVVCPTTVLSHWKNKFRDHVPGLKASVYYGGQRDLQDALRTTDVLLTSYGILWRDIAYLRPYEFKIAVFDEIQFIKNPQTQAYRAAMEVRSDVKMGLTGTPIENTLDELKALLDLTVPGYLGPDDAFRERYVIPIQQNQDKARRAELSRLTAPFTLRRRKSMVLHELPEKIEDIRACILSEDQVKLYRDAISSRGRPLLEALQEENGPVPYMHIFALLNILKQICDHPALLDGGLEDYDQYESGKWELFKELLVESLGSGQKVVVYSQYLGMLQIMERFLRDGNIGFVTLTGKSRNRGEIIERFNKDADCLVYLGSLRAGGVGVDLVAASVVIHYDRWWNAAKEDQATDRVHRIGQRRGVQVFKLVTEGTLEEKIAAIIDRKRRLMESIVKEDDPDLLKSFTREELIEMLAEPD